MKNPKNKNILVAVTTDVVSDMRVQKICNFLKSQSCNITVIGRNLPTTFLKELPYEVKLLKIPFYKGVLFYITFQICLFIRGIFVKSDIIIANDLDTLLPCYLLSKLKKCELVYDSHEYYTESAGLIGKKYKKKVWETLEEWIFPKLKHIITVNESIAKIYSEKYRKKVHVVKNIPFVVNPQKTKSKVSLGLNSSAKIVLLQGSYIDIDRGGKELIESIQYTNSNIQLVIIGSGQELPLMKKLTQELKLTDKILFIPKLPSEQLIQYTLNADLGISIDKPTNLNYKLSLPNKLFDYMHAEIPILISNLPELIRIHEKFPFGPIINSHSPIHIATKIEEGLFSSEYTQWKKNLKEASKIYTWENELYTLKKVYSKIL